MSTISDLLASGEPEDPLLDDPDGPRTISAEPSRVDRVFRGTSALAAFIVLGLMSFIGLFLLWKALPALRRTGLGFLTEQRWLPDTGHFGIRAVLVGTIEIGLVALVIALPASFAAALYISEYAPRRLRGTLISVVDLMAAVPSIVYGLWGLIFLQPHIISLSRWLSDHLGWIPIFKTDRPDFTSSTFIAGVVVSLMVMPISCSIMREVFSQAPPGEREGAYALGSTQWGMIRTVVLPWGKGGIVGGTMLGLGRALGETIAVYLIISPSFITSIHILQGGSNSISALIALRYSESSTFGLSGLMAAGLVLFILTLIINSLASIVVSRSRSGSAVEI
jgi:phosphate transport system permease protein